MANVPTQCDGCGQVDDHPKLHYGVQTYHHDCTPYVVKQAVLDGAHSVDRATTAAVFDACEGGLRGDELRAHIFELHARES